MSYETKQNKTKQNKTKQNKTKQNKTKYFFKRAKGAVYWRIFLPIFKKRQFLKIYFGKYTFFCPERNKRIDIKKESDFVKKKEFLE